MASRNFGRLTRSELRIVRAILAGNTSTTELVAALPAPTSGKGRISKRTIQTHLANIYAKTGAFNKADLVLMALGGKPCEIDLARQVAEPERVRRIREHVRTAAR